MSCLVIKCSICYSNFCCQNEDEDMFIWKQRYPALHLIKCVFLNDYFSTTMRRSRTAHALIFLIHLLNTSCVGLKIGQKPISHSEFFGYCSTILLRAEEGHLFYFRLKFDILIERNAQVILWITNTFF